MASNFVSYRTSSRGAEVSQDPLDRFAQSLHHMVVIELQMISPTFFLRYLKGRCHGNQFCGKITYPPDLSLWHSETEWDIVTSMCALTAQMMSLYCVKIS